MFRSPLAARLSLAGAMSAVAMIGTVAITAPQAPAHAADTAIGPAVGTRLAMTAPLLDSAGKPTTLAKMAGGKPMMVVMFRSAKWCPYCQAQLKGLGPAAARAKAKGMRFVAVSYDAPATLAAFAAAQNITFPMVSDTGGAMFKAMGLRDPRYAEGTFAYGVPYPTILALDARGTIKAKSVETDYKQRPDMAAIAAMMDMI